MAKVKAKLLVVDDEPDMLSTCLKFLTGEGYEVEVAENGRAAVERVEMFQPDLVITDLKMPGMDGMEVLRRIKENQPDTTVMMFTGFGTIEDAVEGRFILLRKGKKRYHLVAVIG